MCSAAHTAQLLLKFARVLSQENYHDIANVDDQAQEALFQQAKTNLAEWSTKTVFLRNYTSNAIHSIPDQSLDYIYVDARHDYCGVTVRGAACPAWVGRCMRCTHGSSWLPGWRCGWRFVFSYAFGTLLQEDLELYWPKLKPGGIFAGSSCVVPPVMLAFGFPHLSCVTCRPRLCGRP